MDAAADPTTGLAAPGATAPAELYAAYAPLWAEEEVDRGARWGAFLADLAEEDGGDGDDVASGEEDR